MTCERIIIMKIKLFAEGLMKWKTMFCYIFTGSVMLYSLINIVLGHDTLSISGMISILLVSSVGTLLQFLAFSGFVIKNLKYTFRLILFVVPFFAFISACAVIFKWFPTDVFLSWLIFASIFILIFIIITIVFEIYFRVTGRKYDGLLGKYKSTDK